MQSSAPAFVAAASAATALYLLLRKRANDEEPQTQTGRSSSTPTVDLTGARLRRLAAAGFTTPMERRVENGVCIISLGGVGDATHKWGTKTCEHRLYPAAILALDEALDAAESDAAVRAIVLTAEGKFFCNGFDLKFLQQHSHLMDDVQRMTEMLCARILRFPKPTIAAVNGHACAAGAMLMLCFDEVVMNSERGYCFVPGIDLGLTYSPGMAALMSARLPFSVRHGFIVMGERLTGPQLAKHAVVKAAPPDKVLPEAVARAVALKPKAAHGATMSSIKATLYHEAIAALEVEPDIVVVEPQFVPMGFGNLPEGVDKPARSVKAPSRAPSVEKVRPGSGPQSPTPQALEGLKRGAYVAAAAQSKRDLLKWAEKDSAES